MPPKGYRTITVRSDVAELLARAKRLFHKSQIQILLEAISEYIGRHYEYGSAVLATSAAEPVAVAWSAGVFESMGFAYRHPSPAMKIAVEVTGPDRILLAKLKDIWGGTIYREKEEIRGGEGKELWFWGLRSEKAKRFLQSILPYMKGPKSQIVKDCLSLRDAASVPTSARDAGRVQGATEAPANNPVPTEDNQQS